MLTCTETSSGLQREFWSDLTASSAVNLPITRASLRLDVIWMGVESILCTYSVARVVCCYQSQRVQLCKALSNICCLETCKYQYS